MYYVNACKHCKYMHVVCDFTVQGPMALQNTTSPTGAIVATGPITFSVEFDQEVNPTLLIFCKLSFSTVSSLLRLADLLGAPTSGFMRAVEYRLWLLMPPLPVLCFPPVVVKELCLHSLSATHSRQLMSTTFSLTLVSEVHCPRPAGERVFHA